MNSRTLRIRIPVLDERRVITQASGNGGVDFSPRMQREGITVDDCATAPHSIFQDPWRQSPKAPSVSPPIDGVHFSESASGSGPMPSHVETDRDLPF